ncbi:MAG: 4-hydroxybenzoate octaprenyltransferase [Proteobacteria bacterium]|nr:4-hydroxybenzoate octaprenyltransferase [Pseudomonadota bacterium]
MPQPPPATDLRPPSYWRRLPPSLRQAFLLIRLDRPIGWWLLLLPGWVALPHSARLHASPEYAPSLIASLIAPPTELGYALSSPIAPPTELSLAMLLFFLGAVIARGAGCIINDLWDRDLDRQTARTKLRPLASGALPPKTALCWLAFLTVLALVILACLPPAAALTALTATPLIILYPLTKRWLPLPQLVLAPTFSWAALAGWAVFAGLPFAILGDGFGNASQSWLAAACLYGGFTAWVFGYDTIYAIQDMTDDKRLGVGSSALTLGAWLPVGVGVAYGLALFGWGVAAVLMSAGVGFWLALGVAAWHLVWQVRRVQRLYSYSYDGGADGKNAPAIAGEVFRSNRNLGLILVAGSVGDYCLALAIL